MISTFSSTLCPVLWDGSPAMLKCARMPEEIAGNAIMVHWDGQGSAPVLAHENNALVMARATGIGDLAGFARTGIDSFATQILVRGIQRLHETPPPSFAVISAEDRFAALLQGPECRQKELATKLLSEPSERVLLHGDLHHENLLDFSELGWLAIDPKGVIGPPIMDYMPMLMNPDITLDADPAALENMENRVIQISKLTGHPGTELLRWLEAYTALSAAWSLADGCGEAARQAHRLGQKARTLLAAMQ